MAGADWKCGPLTVGPLVGRTLGGCSGPRALHEANSGADPQGGVMKWKVPFRARQVQNGGDLQRLLVVGLLSTCLLLPVSTAMAGSPTELANTAGIETASSAGGEIAGTVTVTTEPVGATVYVGGQPRGETPVEIAGLAAGDHRITIVKDGYIDNSRVLRLAPDRNESLNVALTPSAGGSSATELQEDSGEGGGGWWKWAALAGGGGAAAYLLLPKNKPPVAGLSVTPGGSGMAGLTEYRFDGGASSDPDNDQLTYSWNFGDGGSGSGRNATHVYDSAGTYTVTLTVNDGKEQATATSSVTVTQNLAGTYTTPTEALPAIPGVGSLRVSASLRLTQSDTRLGGELTLRFSGSRNVTFRNDVNGSISSSNNFICPCDVRFATSPSDAVSFTGTVNNGATEMTGTYTLVVTVTQGAKATRYTIRGPAEFRRQ